MKKIVAKILHLGMLFSIILFSAKIASASEVKSCSEVTSHFYQNLNPDSILITGNSGWTLIKTTLHVKVYAKETDCNDSLNGIHMKNVILRIENQTNNNIEVSWSNKLYYDYKCMTCNSSSGENDRTIVLSPSATVEGNCGPGQNDLVLFIEMVGSQSEKLTSFELFNFNSKVK